MTKIAKRLAEWFEHPGVKNWILAGRTLPELLRASGTADQRRFELVDAVSELEQAGLVTCDMHDFGGGARAAVIKLKG